jgi:putative ATP-dependent endonuclease of OLD family
MHIRRLELRRYRRFQRLRWHPLPGLNCLIGPGDGGKTSLLDAVALLFSPSPSRPASERDYHNRDVEAGFEVEALLGGLTEDLFDLVRPPALWNWEGEEAEPTPLPTTEPVLRLLVRGTRDLEIEHRLISPDGDELYFSADKRRALGLCRVGELAETARDLRMARGSLLERSLGSEELRAAAAASVRQASAELEVSQEVTDRLAALGELMSREGVADGELSLQLVAPAGQNLLGMLGLASAADDVALPLSFAGQGTQRLAVFVLAMGLAREDPIAVVDEAEVGLEPYRQRQLISRVRELVGERGQAFLTTHSAVVLASLKPGELHRLQPQIAEKQDEQDDEARGPGAVLALAAEVAQLIERDAEALLARLPLVCEGKTEMHLVGAQLRVRACAEHLDLEALGIRLVDGCGQPQAVTLIEGLRGAGLPVAGWLDEERQCVGRRQALRDAGVALGRFTAGSSTESAIADELTIDALDAMLDVQPPTGFRRGDSRRQQLGQVLGKPGIANMKALADELGEAAVKEAWVTAATKRSWFKPHEDALALAEHFAANGLPPAMRLAVDTFWRAVCDELGVARSEDEQRGTG